MTTFTLWINSLEALTITGVNKRYTSGPPLAVSTADLPCSYVTLPRAEQAAVVTGPGFVRTLRVDLVVLLEPVGQSTQPTNFDATITMLDSVTTALKGLEASGSLLDGPMTFAVSLAMVEVARTMFWGVVCPISGLG